MLSAKNSSGNGIYHRIFSGVNNEEQLRSAIALAVRELRAAMEKEDNPAVTRAHVRNLQDLNPAYLARAYTLAEKSCVYWPSPGQIRELAGCLETDEAAEALEWVFAYLEHHGIDGKQKSGAVTFGEDDAGRRVLVSLQPTLEPPAMPDVIRRSLARLGGGSPKRGLFCCSQHPHLKGWEEGTAGDSPHRTGERIEQQWARCYRQVLRDPLHLTRIHGGNNDVDSAT